MTNEAEDRNDLVLRGANVLTKLLGIAEPIAGLGLGAIIDSISERRSKRQTQRLHLLVEAIDRRLADLEIAEQSRYQSDLFDEIITSAVNDEDDEKIEIYAALVEYVAAAERRPYEVRLLGAAMRALTIHDINALVHYKRTGRIHPDVPKELEDTFWNRLESQGLFCGGPVKHPNNVSRLGRTLVNLASPLVDATA